VSTADGDRRIDDVWSYDTECDEKVLAKVTNVSVTETDVLVHVITSEGDDIRTTMFHPFYVKSIVEENGSRYNGEWKAASNLIAGDELLADDGRVIYVDEVRIERLAKNSNIYNLEVEKSHTYFVANGILVHNGCGDKNISDENDLFLPDEYYYENRLPKEVKPGIRYLPKYDEFGNVKQIKMYDDFGREIVRVDYTDHNRPNVHTAPHWHEMIWNSIFPKGKNIDHMMDTKTPF